MRRWPASTLNRPWPRREAGKYHDKRAPKEIVLDLDATDDTIHASKKVGSSMATTTAIATCRSTSSAAGSLGAKLRPANIDGEAGAVDEVARIVARIRAPGRAARGDSGFCREELMAWCEAEGVA